MRQRARITSGRGQGTRIGVPTLNFEPPAAFPHEHGIYAGWVWIERGRYPAAFHWGPIPVFGIPQPSLEAHLIEAVLPESPSEAEFELVERLRPVMDFDTPAALVTQIEDDIRRAKAILGLA